MNEKLNEYVEHFGENFPIFMTRSMTEKEVINVIDDCINRNEPYKVEDDSDVSY